MVSILQIPISDLAQVFIVGYFSVFKGYARNESTFVFRYNRRRILRKILDERRFSVKIRKHFYNLTYQKRNKT